MPGGEWDTPREIEERREKWDFKLWILFRLDPAIKTGKYLR
jgi:hypothetical protein